MPRVAELEIQLEEAKEKIQGLEKALTAVKLERQEARELVMKGIMAQVRIMQENRLAHEIIQYIIDLQSSKSKT